jgi:multisubunit Na+/H+ antiporter MnhE subunit
MSGVVLRAAGLTAVYLLVLTSLAPGDVLIGGLLGLALAASLRARRPLRGAATGPARVAAALAVAAQTLSEMIRGSWRVARFCLGWSASPGFVEIPRGGRSRISVALWGVLTGEAPDEVVVDVVAERDVLIVHLVDAREPDAIRARHRRAYECWQRKVVR